MADRLAGRVAIITGAASGIGHASARLFAAEGARVLAVDRPQSSIETAHGGISNISPLAIDITTETAPAVVVSAAIMRFGALDIVFNNAGIAPAARLENLADQEWERVLAVNLTAAMRLTRKALPALRDRIGTIGRARVINTTSVAGRFPEVGCSAYVTSKHGLVGLTRTLALELGPEGITVNHIMPGPIRTPMTSGLFEIAAIREHWQSGTPLRRLGEADHIAQAALLLCTPDADFITGQGLVVDGGLTLLVGPAEFDQEQTA